MEQLEAVEKIQDRKERILTMATLLEKDQEEVVEAYLRMIVRRRGVKA